MSVGPHKPPYIALVDDDEHSARLMARCLASHGVPEVIEFGDAASGKASLYRALHRGGMAVPGLLIVDLKSHSWASRDFIVDIAPLIAMSGLLVVAMALTPARVERQAYLAAAASAVFRRYADRKAYQNEAKAIVRYWAEAHGLQLAAI